MGNLREERTGETTTNTKGLKMTVKAYRKYKDIDVMFEDGSIREHMDYGSFKKGQISHPDDTGGAKAARRIGERRKNKWGQAMEITDYRGANDIDVAFEDGSVRKHMGYSSFKKGTIRHPSETVEAKARSRVGEKKTNKAGLAMEIAAYRNCNDIDVVFEDGSVREHTHYHLFKKGQTSHPSETAEGKAESRVGEKRMNSAGEMMEITVYRKHSDIDVVFEDGSVRKHKSYHDFKKGRIRHHPLCGSAPEGMLTFILESAGFSKRLVASGGSGGPVSSVEIDAFNEERNIGVEYDGAHWHQDTERDLRKNRICGKAGVTLLRIREKGCPELDDPSVPVFEVHPSKWKNLRDSNVFDAFRDELERSGFVAFMKDRFRIALPGPGRCSEEDYLKWLEESDYTWNGSRRVGERRRNNRGQTMEIAAYRNAFDIDVVFEDGAVREHVRYVNFKRGSISHPDATGEAKAEGRVGERKKNAQGRMMEVTAYRSWNDIDVVFEDGAVRTGISYGQFKSGYASHPDDTSEAKAEGRLGEKRKNNAGQTMEIVSYRNAKDIDVAFEDGDVRKHVEYGNFKRGSVSHPLDTPGARAKERIGERNRNNQGRTMRVIAYRSCSDIDVAFEDGAVRRHTCYKNFKNGSVSHP